jgi:glycosyltransferase involved in cell wall biosynthesis
MNIHIYADAISRKNGGSSSILDLFNSMQELGHQVKIFTFFGKLDRFLYQAEDFDSYNKVYCHDKKLIIKSRRSKFNIFSSFSESHEIPDIVIDNIHLLEVQKNRKVGRKTKYILNHAGSFDAFSNFFVSKYPFLYKDFIKSYDGLLFQSMEQCQEVENKISSDETSFNHLYPSISKSQVNKFSNEIPPFVKSNKLNICLVGSLQKRKGQIKLIEIVNYLGQYNQFVDFHLIGGKVDKDYYNEIKTLISQNNINNIFILGHKKKYVNYIKNADLMMQLSQSEGISRIVREAFYFGIPFLSFDIIGSNEIFQNGVNSITVKYGATSDIAASICQIIDKKINIKDLKINAKKTFEEKFEYSKYKNNLENLLQKIKN